MMRQILSLQLIFLLPACAPGTRDTIDQDDWTLMDERSEPMHEREDQHLQSCPRGMKAWCTKSFSREECNCIDEAEFRDRILIRP
jgi:hypothetical protein